MSFVWKRTRLVSAALMVVVPLSLACTGEVGEVSQVPSPSASPPGGGAAPGGAAPGGTSAAGSPESGSATAPNPGAAGAEIPFALTRVSLRLLPFETRLRRLAEVAGLPVADLLFEPLRARNVDLGDANYALGVNPDPSWSPPKITLWTKLLRPVCASGAMKGRYPQLATDPTALMAAAYGRAIDDEDRKGVIESVAKLPTAEAKASTTCLAVLSSAEFLAL